MSMERLKGDGIMEKVDLIMANKRIEELTEYIKELKMDKETLSNSLVIESNRANELNKKVEYLEKFMDDFITNYQARFYGNE